MKVSGCRIATRGPPVPGPPFGDQAVELLPRLAQVPAPRQLLGDVEADVVAGARVLGPGVAEADDEDAVALLAAVP